MLNITRLLGAQANFGDRIRYGNSRETLVINGSGAEFGPVVVLNLTSKCNLGCAHCYASAGTCTDEGSDPAGTGLGESDSAEMTTAEIEKLFVEFGEMKVPAVLLSGGEPLLREDIFEIAELAKKNGLRATLSTNGTLIDDDTAHKIAAAEFSYVGISIDGTELKHDEFRNCEGAFERSITGVRRLKENGVKTGIRFTATRDNHGDLPFVLALGEEIGVDRMCIYHLVHAGRGREIMDSDLTHSQSRDLMDLLFQSGKHYVGSGNGCELLTVDNHCDGVYLYLKVLEQDERAAAMVWEQLARNGGNNSGEKIACVDHRGDVHPDQFWTHYSLGNIREQSFKNIWLDDPDHLLVALRSRKGHLKERCRSCRFLSICNGNFRVRAELGAGDLWSEDPACYLTDQEVMSS